MSLIRQLVPNINSVEQLN